MQRMIAQEVRNYVDSLRAEDGPTSFGVQSAALQNDPQVIHLLLILEHKPCLHNKARKAIATISTQQGLGIRPTHRSPSMAPKY
ncbi:hypothetical protein GBA52_006618 [Prunus armeniaca]|nr:hypothetical protein GBA52_006618 [Prunus armeniaca]